MSSRQDVLAERIRLSSRKLRSSTKLRKKMLLRALRIRKIVIS